MSEDFAKYERMMPEGSTPLVGIAIVKYLDADGEGSVNWHIDGSPTRETLAGILETVKWDALRSFIAALVEHSEDDDA